MKSFLLRRTKIQLPVFAKSMIYGSVAVLLITGVMLYLSYTLAYFEVGSMSALGVKLHGITGLIFLILMGYIFNAHLPYTLKLKAHRVLGITLLVILAVTVLSGFGLYYLPYDWIENTKELHFGVSLVFALIFSIHIWRGRVTR